MQHTKKIMAFFIATLVIVSSSIAQAPQRMSNQSVIRNANGALVSNQAVSIKITLLQGSATGTVVYIETQNITTNSNGLVSFQIGGGTVVSGNFATINWANGPYFVKTEADPTGGTNYSIAGTTQLLSVAYALYASQSGTIADTTNSGIVTTSSQTFGGAKTFNNNVVVNGKIGIGTSSPATSAKLDVTSTTQGFLPPRMTLAQRIAISNPATGLLVFQTDGTAGYYFFNGISWDALSTTSQASSIIPTGTVFANSGNTAPQGWLVCNGQAVSRTTYSTLFASIGTTYGKGDGSTTFNLPDLQGRTIIGAGLGSGLTSRTIGQIGGEEYHTLALNEMPTHTHFINDPGHSHAAPTYAGTYRFGSGSITGDYFSSYGITSREVTGISLQSAGGGFAHNIMQPYLVMQYIIKY